MICDNCKLERLVDDFINNQKFCYHCTYRIKTEKRTEIRKENELICRCCENKFIIDKSQKKRQRTVFCSKECAQKGHKNQLNNHWTRKIRKENPCNSGVRNKWKIKKHTSP